MNEDLEMHDDEGSTPGLNLSPNDAKTLDRIFEEGLDSFTCDDPQDRRVLDLLSLLDTPVHAETQRHSRIDIVQLIASRLEQSDATPELTQEDRSAIDQYFEHQLETGFVEASLRPRAAQVDRIGMLVTQGAQTESGDSLVDRTLAGIQAHIDAEESALNIGSRGRGQLSMRWGDLVSIAAMLLLAASVIMPIMSGMRSSARQAVCFDNMDSAANAFGLYSGANRDMLPMATAGFGPTWMDVGTTPERSNSSNLYTLIRKGFTGLDDLACPSNPDARTGQPDPQAWDWESLPEVSYSYRIMPRGGMRATMSDQPVRVVILADRSPVVLRVAAGKPIIPEQNSPNHKYSAQHMLMLDGSAQWATTPMLENRDNIWLPRPIEQVIHTVRVKSGIITGNEQPDGPTDALVGP